MKAKFAALFAAVALCVPVAPLAAMPAPAADKNKPVSDDFLSDTIMRKLASDAIIKGGAIKVDVKDGVVTLSGTIETEKQRERTEKVVKKTAGVKGVVNKITVAAHN